MERFDIKTLPPLIHCWLTLAMLLTMLSTNSARAETYELEGLGKVDLRRHLLYLEDSRGSLSLEQIVSSQQDWIRNGNEIFSKGFSKSHWWFKFELKNPGEKNQQRILEIANAVLDQLDIYVFRGDQKITSIKTGDLRPFSTRPLDYRFYAKSLTWHSQEVFTVYIHVKTSSAVQLPITLWQPSDFFVHEADNNILQGLYYGAMGVIAVYNLFIFFALRDRSYLYYVGFILSGPLFFLTISGQGYRYIWTDSIAWNELSIPVGISLLVLFGALFTRNFIGLSKVSKILDRLILVFVAIGGIMLCLSFFLPYRTMLAILIPVSILACISDLTVGCIAWYRGVASARFYVIAWVCFLVATILYSLQKISILPSHTMFEYGVQIGSMLEAVLLSFALADRIHEERALRFQAQEEAISTVQRLNQELESRVEERTAELESLNQKLEELSITDQLTKLFNRRYLEEEGEKVFIRCARYGHPLSVLIIDLDYFKVVNDKYGHHGGDECLRRVSHLLKNNLRTPTDIVARYGGEEFCMLLPETDAESALIIAERIRSQVENMVITSDLQQLNITTSIGAYSFMPSRAYDLNEALKCADQALYQSKAEGRNKVTLFK